MFLLLEMDFSDILSRGRTMSVYVDDFSSVSVQLDDI